MSRVAHHRPQYPDQFGQFKMSYHLEMISDRARTGAIFESLRRALAGDAVFCELGCGTGIFSIYAAGRCRKVYAVELDPAVAAVARANIEASRFAERIELIVADALTVELPERVDAIFCEMMSIWTIEEPQVPVANRAWLDLLKPDGLFLPSRIINQAELGSYPFGSGEIVMKAATPLFTSIPRPAVLTERLTCKVLDFSGPVDRNLGVDQEFTAAAEGEVNCVVLSSIVQVGPGVVFSGSDSLMPPTVIPLARALTVNVGDRLRFRASVRARTDLGEASFVAELV
jgi:predicted RNA methylase